MKRTFLALCVSALVLVAFAGTAWSADRALIISISEYRDGEINDLPGGQYDEGIMKNVVSKLGFASKDILALKNEKATMANIKREIDHWLINGTTSGDRALIYFSGHGTQIKDLNGDEDDGLDEALVPYDAQLGNDDSLLSDDVFNTLLNKIPAGETIVLIDSCHSGTATKGISIIDDGLRAKYIPWPGVGYASKGHFDVKPDNTANLYVALAACRDNETAISGRHGSLFTLGIDEAVKKASDGFLSISDIKNISADYIAMKLNGHEDLIHTPSVSGNKSLAGKNLFLGPTPGSQQNRSELWQETVAVVGQANYKLNGMHINSKSYAVGDNLEISVDVDRSGYLNIINLGAEDDEVTILFPNRFVKQNHVKGGEAIHVPGNGGNFKLTAQPPAGDTLIVAFHTEEPLNLWEMGNSDPKSVFASIGLKEMRAFVVESTKPASNNDSFGAAMVETTITAK